MDLSYIQHNNASSTLMYMYILIQCTIKHCDSSRLSKCHLTTSASVIITHKFNCDIWNLFLWKWRRPQHSGEKPRVVSLQIINLRANLFMDNMWGCLSSTLQNAMLGLASCLYVLEQLYCVSTCCDVSKPLFDLYPH